MNTEKMRYNVGTKYASDWLCKSSLSTWKCDSLGCPFIKARNYFHNGTRLTTLIILQDYGRAFDEMSLLETAEKLKPFFNSEIEPDDYIRKDPTLNRLFEVVGKKTQNGEVAITNAVWALRNDQSKTGYLGDLIHKKWYENWLEIIKDFLNNGCQRVIFCGEWARFDNHRENQKFDNGKEFIERWSTWANIPHGISPCTKFKVWLVRHPSAPSIKDNIWISTSEKVTYIEDADLRDLLG